MPLGLGRRPWHAEPVQPSYSLQDDDPAEIFNMSRRRAAALRETSPAAILQSLNELLLVLAADGELEPRFCTGMGHRSKPFDRLIW